MKEKDRSLHSILAEQAAEWHVAHRAGELSLSQKQEFMRWLRASPQHVAEYLAIAEIAHDAAILLRDVEIPAELLFAETEADLRITPLQPSIANRSKAPNRPIRARVAWSWATAAVALIVLGLSLGNAHWLRGQPASSTFATARGEQHSWTLPDGSHIHLNSDSRVVVRYGPKQRLIEVERGQALFDVAGDPERPFRVRSGDSLIEDVGTVFDVFRMNADSTSITVSEGRVTLYLMGTISAPKRMADLQAGQKITIASRKAGPVTGANLQKSMAWTQQLIIFDEDPIADVASQFNRYNDIQLQIDDVAVSRIPISGVFRYDDIASFTAFLKGLPDVQVRSQGNTVHVTAASSTQEKYETSAR